MLDVVGTPSDPQQARGRQTLQAWIAAGAHRRDRDQDGIYEHADAIQIMDAWWPRRSRPSSSRSWATSSSTPCTA